MRKPDDTLKVILTIDKSHTDQSIPGNELLFALKQFFDYQLFSKFATYKIIPADQTGYIDSILADSAGSSWKTVLHIQAAALSPSEVIYRKNSFSRRSFTVQKNMISIQLRTTLYNKSKNGYSVNYQYKVVENSKQEWFEFNPDETGNQSQSLFYEMAEPIEFIIQRAVMKIIKNIPDGIKTTPKSGKMISATFYLDSSFITSATGSWEKKLQRMTEYTSKSLYEQFGYELQSKNLQLVNLHSENEYSMSALFKAIKKSDLPVENRLSILLLNKNNRVEYFTSGRYDKVGLAEIGKHQIIVNELPSPENRQSDWQPFQNSLILIHEIGHTLGAIHVSDQFSVMNKSLNWLASDRFDPFNKTIVADALSAKLKFNNKIKYLNYLADLLLTTDYHLVDIPYMFYTFINGSDRSPLFKKLNENKEYKPFILAASGYGYMQNNFHDKAAEDFRQAIQYLPMEASLYYYLSLVTTGEESTRALKKAAASGYWEAVQKQQTVTEVPR